MATLTVTLQESLILNGTDYGSINSTSVSSVVNGFKRTDKCLRSINTSLAAFASSKVSSDELAASGPFLDAEDVAYIRFTNLDSANTIEIAVIGTTTLYQITLAPGHSHILSDCDDFMLAEEDTSPSFGTMLDLRAIKAQPVGSVDIDVEIFIAIK